MSKLGLIIRREYLTRVTKKSFIIGTLLAPLATGFRVLSRVGRQELAKPGRLLYEGRAHGLT